METLKAGDKRLSVTRGPGTRITTAFDSKQAVVREITLNHGVFFHQVRQEETATYTARNVDQKLDAHHRTSAARRLHAAQPEADGEDADYYRFEVHSRGATKDIRRLGRTLFDSSYWITIIADSCDLHHKRDLNGRRKQLERIAIRNSRSSITTPPR